MVSRQNADDGLPSNLVDEVEDLLAKVLGSEETSVGALWDRVVLTSRAARKGALFDVWSFVLTASRAVREGSFFGLCFVAPMASILVGQPLDDLDVYLHGVVAAAGHQTVVALLAAAVGASRSRLVDPPLLRLLLTINKAPQLLVRLAGTSYLSPRLPRSRHRFGVAWGILVRGCAALVFPRPASWPWRDDRHPQVAVEELRLLGNLGLDLLVCDELHAFHDTVLLVPAR
mmetsp:Transcript_21884/g.68535  ORF Transcript_21884/g.68535 Transcript_21884/m.68535 type:complete len:230 (-) Transcript_21884:328-1017(-)